MRWTDSRNAAPGIERFVDRIGSFLVLVGPGRAGRRRGWHLCRDPQLSGRQGRDHRHAEDPRRRGRADLPQLPVADRDPVRPSASRSASRSAPLVPLLAAPLIEASLPFPAEIRLSPGALGRGRLLRHPLRPDLHPPAPRPDRTHPPRRPLSRWQRHPRLAPQALPRGPRRSLRRPDRQRHLAVRHPRTCPWCRRRHPRRPDHPRAGRPWPPLGHQPPRPHQTDPRPPRHPRRPCRHRRAKVRRDLGRSCRSASAFRCWPPSARSTGTCARPSPPTCRPARPPSSSSTSSPTSSTASWPASTTTPP